MDDNYYDDEPRRAMNEYGAYYYGMTSMKTLVN